MLSFVFVRHPYERLESAYFDKIVGNAANESRWWEFMVNSIRQKCKCFIILYCVNIFADNSTSPNAFIQFVIDENKNKRDPYKVNEH